MRNPTTLTVIKNESGKRQIQFAGLVIGLKETREEGVAFAKNYEHGLKIEVWEDGTLVEEIEK